MARVPFSREERAYLLTLPAVMDVSEYRIRYATWFRNSFVRRYRQGESPVSLFREAGLDPKIVGYKRIERCVARWADLPDDVVEPASMPPKSVDGGSSLGMAASRAADSDTLFTRALVLMQSKRISELEERIGKLESNVRQCPQIDASMNDTAKRHDPQYGAYRKKRHY